MGSILLQVAHIWPLAFFSFSIFIHVFLPTVWTTGAFYVVCHRYISQHPLFLIENTCPSLEFRLLRQLCKPDSLMGSVKVIILYCTQIFSLLDLEVTLLASYILDENGTHIIYYLMSSFFGSTLCLQNVSMFFYLVEVYSFLLLVVFCCMNIL